MSGYGLRFGFSRVGVVLFSFFLALLVLLAFGFRAGLLLRVGVVRSFFPFLLFRVRVLSRPSPGGHDGHGAASQERSRRAQKRPPREFPLGYDLIVRQGPGRFWINYLSVFVRHGLLLPSIIVFDFLRSLSFPLLPIRPEEGLTQLNHY